MSQLGGDLNVSVDEIPTLVWLHIYNVLRASTVLEATVFQTGGR